MTTNGRTEKEQDEREVAERGMGWGLRIRPLSPLLSSFLFLPLSVRPIPEKRVFSQTTRKVK